MLEAIDEAVSINSLIWLFLAAFMIHDFEEIITVEGWMRRNYDQVSRIVPDRAGRILKDFSNITGSQFAVAVFFEFILFIPFTYLAAEHRWMLLFTGFNTIMLIHVFTHVGQSIYLRRYTPGVVTAVLVTLPYSMYLFYRLLDAGLVYGSVLAWSIPVGAATVLPVVRIGHQCARRIAPNR
ncbi:HXXEE domain-containing protein [Paenibacillus cineris]|uniref:HXXEE domain-containing protein n=1 Tax=Paenibacillus cineris TaxID=237530 RepID=A0ABQ4LER1_9BACL|nr:HXXEE domain-containing protein [Paenibacillus cineris]GIO54815.1 hypothetical protein J21TS7_31330 [Paenibacillus cineris]